MPEPRHDPYPYPAVAPQPGDAAFIRRETAERALELNDEQYDQPVSDVQMDEFAEHLRLDRQIEDDLDALMAQSGVRRTDVESRIQELIGTGRHPWRHPGQAPAPRTPRPRMGARALDCSGCLGVAPVITRGDYIDRNGNWILTASEPCRFCGRESREIHPAGVVVGRWLCSCGQRQSDPIKSQVDSE